MALMKTRAGAVVHDESPAGILAQAENEIAREEMRAAIEREKTRIRERRARPWWKRVLPFYITVRFHWNWSN